MAQVLKLLSKHGAIAEYQAIDMALHPEDVIDEFKERQAAALTASLTAAHSEAFAHGVHRDADAIRSLANQILLQALASIELILDVLDVTIPYYAQRRPAELGRFAWAIDRKDRTITEMERLWSELILPIGESRSLKRPYATMSGLDYSHFAKYEIDETTTDETMRSHLQWMREMRSQSRGPSAEPLRCIDAKKIWNEERAFAESRNSLGLQLADIAATSLCRALNGNLQAPGWNPMAHLLIRKAVAPFLQIGKAADGRNPPGRLGQEGLADARRE